MSEDQLLRLEGRTVSGTMPPHLTRQNRVDQFEFALAVAAIFLAPANFLRHPSVYITLGDVFTFACLAFMLLRRTIPSRPFDSSTPIWIFGLMLLVSGLLVSSITTGDSLRGIIVSTQYFTAYFIVPLVILQRPPWQLSILIKTFVLSVVIMGLHGIYLIHIDGEVYTRFVSGSGRLKSFVERENECASVFAMTFPLLFWLVGMRYIRPAIFLICFTIFAYGIMLTGSNTGLLGMLYACFVYLALTSLTSLRRLILVVVGSTALVFLLSLVWGALGRKVLPPVFQQRVLGALQSGDLAQAGTFTSRYELILEGLEMVENSILLGVGADQYRLLSKLGHVVHNAYLLIWAEGGLFAMMGFVLLILAALSIAPGAIRREGGRLAGICTFSSVSLFALLVNSVPHVYGRFWAVPLFLGVATSLAQSQKTDAQTLGSEAAIDRPDELGDARYPHLVPHNSRKRG